MHPTGEHPHLRLVALGGGGGSAQTLLAARPFFADRAAIIAVTDAGRSTGAALLERHGRARSSATVAGGGSDHSAES